MTPSLSQFLLYIGTLHMSVIHSWPWQMDSVLPTDLVGAQIGIWNDKLHLINGAYNSTKLDYPQDTTDLVLWLTTDLSASISMDASGDTATIDSELLSWDILTATNSLGGFLCYSKCSTQIGQYLYVISPEQLSSHSPTGYLIVYDLETQQLIVPPTGLTETPYYLNGGACVVHNDSHLFILGGYNTQCPTTKFGTRCNDPDHIVMYDTNSFNFTLGAALPDAAKVDSAACAMDGDGESIYLFGGYNKWTETLSDRITKYMVAVDAFDGAFDGAMSVGRSELNAVPDYRSNHVYLIGGAVDVATDTATLVQVYDMKHEGFVRVDIDALPSPVRWYGSSLWAYDGNIDLLLIVGGHTGTYQAVDAIYQNMTQSLQYLILNNATDDSYTAFPSSMPTAIPSAVPSSMPTDIPSAVPSGSPSQRDTTLEPTLKPPTMEPTLSTQDALSDEYGSSSVPDSAAGIEITVSSSANVLPPFPSPTSPPSAPSMEPTLEIAAAEELEEDSTTSTSSRFERWLFDENNLNWIIVLVLCCFVMPFCILLVYLLNQHSTRKLLREHKNEMRKFQTLSTSRTLTTGGHASEYTYSHPAGARHAVHRTESDMDECTDDEVADGLYATAGAKQRKYHHIPQKQSLDGQYTIKMYNEHVAATNGLTNGLPNGLSNAMATAHTLAVPDRMMDGGRSPLHALSPMKGAQYIISPMDSPSNQLVMSQLRDSMDDDDDDSYDRNGMRIRHHVDCGNDLSTDTNELITRKRGDTVRTETGFTAETEDILKQFPLYDDAECMEYQEPMAINRASHRSNGGSNGSNGSDSEVALDSQMVSLVDFKDSDGMRAAELNAMSIRQRVANQQSDLHRLVRKSKVRYDSEMTISSVDTMTTMDDADGDGRNGQSHRDSLDLGHRSGSGRGVLVNETSSNVRDSHEELEATEHDEDSTTNHRTDVMSLNSITTFTQEMGSLYHPNHGHPAHHNPGSPGMTAISSLERRSRKVTVDETSIAMSNDDYFVVNGKRVTRAPGLIPLNSNSTTTTLTTVTPTVHCMDQVIGANVASTVSMLSTKSPRDSEMKQSVLDQHSTAQDGTHRTMVTVSTHFTTDGDEFAMANHSAFSTPEMHKGVRRHGPILPYVELPPLEQSRHESNGRDQGQSPHRGTELAREPTESEVPTLPPEYSQRNRSEDHDAFSETSNDKKLDDMYTINEHVVVNTDDHVVDHEQTPSDGAQD